MLSLDEVLLDEVLLDEVLLDDVVVDDVVLDVVDVVVLARDAEELAVLLVTAVLVDSASVTL